MNFMNDNMRKKKNSLSIEVPYNFNKKPHLFFYKKQALTSKMMEILIVFCQSFKISKSKISSVCLEYSTLQLYVPSFIVGKFSKLALKYTSFTSTLMRL